VLGIVAAGARPAHALLGVAAVSAYLCSVPAIDWLRTHRPGLRPPAVLFGVATAAAGIPLLVAYPALLPIVLAAAAAAIATAGLSLAGRSTSVLVSLAQVLQAVALVPAAAVIAGTVDAASTWRATLAAGIYLVGSVLLVRSMIRGRGNVAYLAASIAFHGAGVVAAALFLPGPYVMLAAGLLGRALALPFAQARIEHGPRRLRPIHIGLVEIAASVALVVVAVVAGF